MESSVTVADGATRSDRPETNGQPTQKWFDTPDGTQLHYLDEGAGPAVVLIHGVGANLDDWVISGIVDDLSGAHRVIAVDRPGYGQTFRRPGEDWTPERQGYQIAALLRHLSVTNAVVVGHSFGVLPALSLGVHSHTVSALVLIGGVFRRGAAVLALTRRFAGPLSPQHRAGRIIHTKVGPPLAKASLPILIRGMFAPQPVPPGYMQRFSVALASRSSQLIACREDGLAIEPSLDRLLPAARTLSCPVHLISGGKDALFDPCRHAIPFGRDLPNAKVTVLPRHGHMVHHTGRSEVTAAIRAAAQRTAGAAH